MRAFSSMHFLTGEELSQKELLALLDGAEALRVSRDGGSPQILKNKTVALLFEKPSLRTRVSFTVGIQELGGTALDLPSSQQKHEEPEDAIRVLQGMVHGVMVRTFAHEKLERMVSKASIPVINGLSDSHHPCQAIADLLTLKQKVGTLKGLKLAYIGDGNNVLHSLLLMAPFVGVDVHFACPSGYQPVPEILERAKERAKVGGARICAFKKAADAVRGVDAVYTDVWTSMGLESESKKRSKAFREFQLNAKLFSLAAPNAIALHCLPMVRGQEITSEIVEHPRSALFQQAENRLHAQKALMIGLFQAKKHSRSRRGLELSHAI